MFYYSINIQNIKQISTMRKNNQQQFDFELDEDIQQSPKISPKSNNNKKKKAVIEQDNYQLDQFIDDQQKNKEKLPTIFPKSLTVAKIQQNKISNQKKSAVKLENLVSKKQNSQDLPTQQTKSSKVQKKERNKSNLQISREQIYPANPKNQHLSVQEQDQNYGQDFEGDEYNEDFQEFNEETKKKNSKNQNEKLQKISQTIKSITKIKQPLRNRNSSRNSDKSAMSQHKIKQNSTYLTQIPSKYVNQVARQFPQINLNNFNADNLNKLNQRVRTMIRKLNEQLNQLLNKNTLLLKAKKQDKPKALDDKLKILLQEKKNNQKILERMIAELKKLKYREGEVKQQDYQIDIHKKIQQYQEKKKQLQKILHRMKLQITNEGKRLYNVIQKKQQDTNQSVKIQLIHIKKQEEKNSQITQQLDTKIQELTTKTEQVEVKYKKIIQQAAQKGIDIQPKGNLQIKYDQLNKKYVLEKKGLVSLQNLMKNKRERVFQENMLIRRKLQNYDSEIKNIYNQINQVITESVNIIEKSKENPKVMKSIEHSLDQISKSLINQQPIDELSNNIQRSYKSTTSDKKVDNKKIETNQQFLPLNPKILAKNIEHLEQNVNAKPNFLKKKQGVVNQKQNKVYQRIWKQSQNIQSDISKEIKPVQQIKHVQQIKPIQQTKPVEQIKPVNDISKPAFMLKKKINNNNINNNNINNNMNQVNTSSENKIGNLNTIQEKKPFQQQIKNNVQQKKIQQIKIEEKKTDIQVNLGPRFLKFRKNQQSNNQNNQINQNSQTDNQPIKKEVQPPKIELKTQNNEIKIKEDQNQSQKPIIITKRFGLNRKKQVPQENNQYSQLAQENKNVQQQNKNKNNNLNPYGPKENIINNNNLQSNKEQKPAFKNPYAPIIQPPKIVQNKPIENINNPYAQNQNQNQYIPQRQGKLKKPKMEGIKQKVNIYETAEEVNVNQVQQPKKELKIGKEITNTHKHEQMDINALLGIKPKYNDPQDDLLFADKNKKKIGGNKKQQDFFGGLDI